MQPNSALGEIEFTMGARARRSAPVVREALRLERVVLNHDHDGTAIAKSGPVASEVVPSRHKPLCWLLPTNRSVKTLERACKLIDWCCACWEIEVYFPVFKTGGRVEALQLASLPKIERALALFTVVCGHASPERPTQPNKPAPDSSSGRQKNAAIVESLTERNKAQTGSGPRLVQS